MIEPTAEERQEADIMEESSEIDNEEMLIDTAINDAEYHLSSNGVEEPEVMENGASVPPRDETIEKDKDHAENLGNIILLLNNKCLTFKVLLPLVTLLFLIS